MIPTSVPTMERFLTSLNITLPRDERFNALTHGLGVLLCLIGIPVLLDAGAAHGDWSLLIGLGVFCVSLLLVYLSSTIYHSCTTPSRKSLWHRIDHICIFFLIAGTHTPLLMYYLDNSRGMFFLALLWGMVLLGVFYKLFFFGRLRLISVFYYMAMGWMALFTIPEMLHEMSDGVLFWIVAGGVAYSLGVIFFLWERLPHHHAIWHLFVLAGSFGHFMAIWQVVGG